MECTVGFDFSPYLQPSTRAYRLANRRCTPSVITRENVTSGKEKKINQKVIVWQGGA